MATLVCKATDLALLSIPLPRPAWLRQPASLREALRTTHQGFGRALVFGTLALVVGFSVLALSRFIPLVYFGVLVSLAMLGGLVGNLLLLPLLLPLVDKDPPPDARTSPEADRESGAGEPTLQAPN